MLKNILKTYFNSRPGLQNIENFNFFHSFQFQTSTFVVTNTPMPLHSRFYSIQLYSRFNINLYWINLLNYTHTQITISRSRYASDTHTLHKCYTLEWEYEMWRKKKWNKIVYFIGVDLAPTLWFKSVRETKMIKFG